MKKVPPPVLSIGAGILLIVLAYALEDWTYDLRPSVSEGDFGANPYLTWMASAYFSALLVAGLMLAWLRFNQLHVPKHPVVSLIYLVLGAMMTVYTLAMISLGMRLNSPTFAVYYPMAPLSLASFASALIACFGLQRLIFQESAL